MIISFVYNPFGMFVGSNSEKLVTNDIKLHVKIAPHTLTRVLVYAKSKHKP